MTGSHISKQLSFAEQIINKYKPYGGYMPDSSLLVLVKENRTQASIINAASNLWLQLNLGVSTNRTTKQSMQINQNLIGQAVSKHFREEISKISAKYLGREFQVFHSISTIFVNRERQPDQARKAERKLIRILADDFFGRTEMIQNNRYVKRDSIEEHNRILRKQIYQEKELQNTKRLVEHIKERVTVQEKVITEIKQTADRGPELKQEQVDGIARTVMKKMEQKLHLEKLRRGL